MDKTLKKLGLWSALFILALVVVILPVRVTSQDQQDDPPTRVARLAYMEGSVSFEPAGETDWVGADLNRPLTTGDKVWSDKDSRAALQIGSAAIRLSSNTGVSFLNLDDHTLQLQLSSGSIHIRVRHLDPNEVFEVDTPNLAFTVSQPGIYRMDASDDGSSTVISIRAGGGEATGNGQTYTLHAGQKGTFSGTNSLNADVEDIGGPDQFDNWADGRDHRYDQSRSAQYLSPGVVGFDDLDDSGDWHADANNGHVWSPHVEAGWAPYHQGHWAWIDPWGYTWVDDSPWGYAPFHYGRWLSVNGAWGWVPGPVAVQPVYAPALVVFVGGGGGGVLAGNVAWFPLGPREVWVPSYPVSQAYMTQVNVSNTNVNTTTVTNVYNTTVINKTTINNVTYVNKTVPGAVTVVPQHAFASAQPVAKAAVRVTPQQIAAAPVSARVAVVPTREAVLGAKAATANHVTAPPAAVMNRQVIAKHTPPPPPPSFAAKQKAMAAHPGQPVGKREMQTLRPASAAARPLVKQAPPGKPATPHMGPPANQPGAARPGQPAPKPPEKQPEKQPAARPTNQPNERPGAAPQNRPPTAEPNRQPETKPETNRPEANRPAPKPETPKPAEHPPAKEPSRPEANRPAPKPETAKPAEHPPEKEPNRPEANRPPNREEPAAKPHPAPPAAEKPATPPKKEPAKPQTPEEKKREEQEKEKPQGA